EDIDAAIAASGEAFDISRSDLVDLLRLVEQRTLERTHGHIRCADVMARDVIKVRSDTTVEDALHELMARNVRTLPVVDEADRVLGAVGLRQLMKGRRTVADVVTIAPTAGPDDNVLSLVPILSDGRH